MKIFHCDQCQELIFFENVKCLNCEHALAFVPDLMDLGTLKPAGENLWTCLAPGAETQTFRLCENYSRENVCNWAVPFDDPNPLCKSCRLTSIIPNLQPAGNKELWYRMEIAKRRLVYTLLHFKLPLSNQTDDPQHGLTFNFLADSETPQSEDGMNSSPQPILTGHADGVITINLAEADDAEREKRRTQLHEPYRTLLGHFRHEVGHYYWDRLIHDSNQLTAFREMFGDDRQDYAQALQHHYKHGAPSDWQQKFISAYASTHPWEDWAETWAHYLHMADTLETAAACGLSLKPRCKNEPALKSEATQSAIKHGEFDQLIESWFSLTFVLNNLNRGLGLSDAYPFVLTSPVIEKLRFIHETIFRG